jgi:hypothetical protein
MKTNKFFNLLTLLGLSLLLVVSACNKDDDDDNTPNSSTKKPAIESKAEMIQVPEAMLESNDPMALQASTMVEAMASMADYFSYFEPPANATPVGNKSTNESWTWFDGEYYWYYTYYETGTMYKWEIKIGTSENNYYDFMLAEEAVDGQSGSLKIYYDAFMDYKATMEDYYFDYEWEIDNDGNLIVEMDYYMGEEGAFKYYGKFMSDGAGELIYYIGNYKYYEMSWTASGTGDWFMYDEDGNIIDSGTW